MPKIKLKTNINTNKSDNTSYNVDYLTKGRTTANKKLLEKYNTDEIKQFGKDKGKPYGFENGTVRGGMESLITPDNVMIATGVASLAKAGINTLGNKFLPNFGKKIGIPQTKFENPNSFYRQIDAETFNEGKTLGVIKGKQNVGQTKENNIINLNKSFGDDAYYKKGSLYSPQKTDYIYEVQKGEEAFIPKVNGRTRNITDQQPIRVSKTPIPLNEAKIYKKDWLQGYKQVEVPKTAQNFKSEINWGKWNKEIPKNTSLMKEYNTIEQASKANGTWMKNPDGTSFQGTPEQFIQQNSSNFKKAFPNPVRDVDNNIQINYHGQREGKPFTIFKPSQRGSHGVGNYTFPGKRENALSYANNAENRVYELYINSNNPQKSLETVFSPEFNQITGRLQPGYDYLKVGNEQVTAPSNYLKSAVRNNGMFDMTNPNIYKAVAPITIGGAAMIGLKNGDYTEQQVQDAMNNKGTKKLSNIYKKGGIIPKYGMGAQVGANASPMLDKVAPGVGTAASIGLNLGGAYNDSVMNDYGNYKSQSDKNMSYFNPAANFDRFASGDIGRGLIGTTLGPMAGILESTGAMDYMFGKSSGDIAEQKAKEAQKQFGNYKNIFGKADNSTFGIKTNNQSMYANGGMKVISNNHFNPTEEVEGGETAQLPNEENIEFNGPTHENGGIKTNLPEGTRIFSDRLKSNGKTFAQIAKPIQNKISKLDNKPTSKALENTKMLFNKQLDNVFNEQESLKQKQEMKKNIFAKGGLKQYKLEGDKPKPGTSEYDELGFENFKNIINSETGKNYSTEEIISIMQDPNSGYILDPHNVRNAFAPYRLQSTNLLNPKYFDINYEKHLRNIKEDGEDRDYGDKLTKSLSKDEFKNYLQSKEIENNKWQQNQIEDYINKFKSIQNKFPQYGNNKQIKQDAVRNYAKNKQIEKQQINDELGAQMEQINQAPIVTNNFNPTMLNGRSLNKFNTNIANPNLNDFTNNRTQVINNNSNIRFQPQESFDNRLPIENNNFTTWNRSVNQNPNWQEPLVYNPKPNMEVASNTSSWQMPIINKNKLPVIGVGPGGVNPFLFNKNNYAVTPGDFYMKNNVPNTGANFNQAKTNYDNVGVNDKSVDSTISPNTTNWSEIGAGVTGLAGMIGQINNNNKIKAPNAFQNVYLSNGPRPDMVDYSAELNAINNDFNSAKQGLRLGSGSYSTQAGNLGKIRADQLNARGKIMQGQENANTQLMNEYKNRIAENANKSQLLNYEIGKENEYNKLGYDQWKAKQNNEAIANATQIGTNIFNNRTAYNNQLDVAQIIANAHPDTVWKSTTKGRYKNGGMIKTKIKLKK